VALQGTALTQNQIKLLQDLRCKVILMLDNDDAGELATVNNGEELLKNNIDLHVVRLSGEKDPDEYILKEGIEAMKDNINHAISFYEFKTKYYKKNKDLSNPEDLAEYINQVLKEINLMKDPVKQETELNRLSSDYNISKEVLRSKLDNILPVKEIKEDVNRIDTKKKTAYTISSEKILYFMMNGSEYIKEYQAKLGFFNEEIYRDIANEIVYFSEKNNGINVADFVTYIEDKDIKDKVKEIVSESFEDNVSVKVMDDYIVSLNKITTKNEIERLRSLMREELDVDKKTKLAMQIAELKKDVLSDARN
jgi:DNA primase